MSDPDLLAAFRKQCTTFGPGAALLLWKGQSGVDWEDQVDIYKELTEE